MSDNFSEKVPLGRTGLMVSRLGIGSSYGVPERACLKAFEKGVNYFFWGSVRTRGMGAALRQIARRDRDDLVFVLQCYARKPKWIRRSIERGLKKARMDTADILLLGWHDHAPNEAIIETALRLKEEGKFRYLGISGHQRPLFQRFIEDGTFDVFHMRYNAAHRGAEREIFPYLPAEDAPGIVSFTNTRWGDLLKAKNMPDGESPITAADCYRFSLSNDHVQVAITGPKNEKEMDDALSILDTSPLSEDESKRLRRIGDHVHGVRSLMSTFG
jgi:aryl-alcohol dehydrogenase-like predicted oxidoreductase